ncbi:MAG TPA: nicotinate-nucleotide--dimethylbenzimidazole phosphoribosyltransferase, partial [Alphaproteobacteria bacterium]
LIYSVGAPSIAQKLLDGGLPVHETAQALDADMQMIEMDTDTTQADDNARGTAFGLMAAEPNTGLIVTTAIGPQDVPEGDFWQKATPNIAAVLGTMISGATARIPVIAEGKGAIAAADMLAKLRPDMMQYVFACESSPEESDGPGYSGSMLAAWGLSQALEEDAA